MCSSDLKVSVIENFASALLTAAQETSLAGSPASSFGASVNITLLGVPAGIRVIPPAASGAGNALALTLSAGSPSVVDQAVAGTPISFFYITTASNSGLSESTDFTFLFGTNNAGSTASTSAIPPVGGTAQITAVLSLAPITVVDTIVPRFVSNETSPRLLQNLSDYCPPPRAKGPQMISE